MSAPPLTRAGRLIARAWNRLWFAPYDPLPAGVFRIALGLLLTAMYLVISPNWERYFSPDGVLSLNDPTLPPLADDWWSLFHLLPGVPLRLFWVLGLVAAVAFTAGWKTRFATVVLFAMETSMIARNRWAINGEDLVGRMLLFYGMFAPLGAALSVDAWLARRKAARAGVQPAAAQPRIWPIRLMQLNIAAVYLISLPAKLTDDVAWLNGQAIYFSVVSNMWSRVPWPRPFYGVLGNVMTYFTIVAEGSVPLLIWFRRTRPFVVAAIASLHLGIAIMLKNVTFFSLTMVCAFCVFLSSAQVQWIWARVRALAGHARAWLAAHRPGAAAPVEPVAVEIARSGHGPVVD
jgi:hypothetical protein